MFIQGAFAYPIPVTTTTLWFSDSLASSQGSTLGRIINITGNGLSNKINDPTVSVKYICGTTTTFLPIITANPIYIKVRLPPTPASTCKINATQGSTSKLYNY